MELHQTAEAAKELELATLSEHVSTFLDKVLQYLETTEAFTVEHMPLLVQEIIRYEMTVASFTLVISLLLAAWAYRAYRWSYRNAEDRLARISDHTETLKAESRRRGRPRPGETEDAVFSIMHYGIPISGIPCSIVGAILFFCSATSLLKITLAPRLYLLEYFRALVDK